MSVAQKIKKRLEPERILARGSDTRRELYASFRGLFNYRSNERRRDLAAEFDSGGPLEIEKSKGFRVFTPGALPGADAVVSSALGTIGETDIEEVDSRKSQLINGLLPSADIRLDSPYFRFILNEDVLRSVSAYLGVIPLLNKVDLWYSRNTKSLSNSQLYHCDWDDISQVKVFVYGTDVDESSGPLVVMGASTSERLREQCGYKYGGQASRVSDEVAHSLVGRNDEHPIVGRKGSVAFVDTSRCFHYGSRVGENASPRIVAMFQFLTPTAFTLPLSYRDGAPFKHMVREDQSALQRLVLGGT